MNLHLQKTNHSLLLHLKINIFLKFDAFVGLESEIRWYNCFSVDMVCSNININVEFKLKIIEL